jgi:GT2 family glycosyltransferase
LISTDAKCSAAMADEVKDRLDGAPAADAMKICVGIATRGRPQTLAAVVGHLRQQTLQPSSIVIACTSLDDVGDLAARAEVEILVGPAGLTRQRNAILEQLDNDVDLVAFFDDDFVPDRDWLSVVARTFGDQPGVACITGHVIADGIKGPGISFEEARNAVAADDGRESQLVVKNRTPYGCNMALRVAAVRDLRFDERLVLYGWLEDLDFGGALARNGWGLVKIGAARGVHMGIKAGRVAGRKLGYSQVMNPAYLARKGTMTVKAAGIKIFRNIAANLAHAFTPEPYIDRRGRLRGNADALRDLCRGRITPERAERL